MMKRNELLIRTPEEQDIDNELGYFSERLSTSVRRCMQVEGDKASEVMIIALVGVLVEFVAENMPEGEFPQIIKAVCTNILTLADLDDPGIVH